ncbi:MAG: uracil-DNA glycosylase [Candidatus Eremiobacteraeota bacterium]|jgi:hypothetical protein|nr:uracil-DNA glycosylase [Candidatus Eremiobacteraeota bacterium]
MAFREARVVLQQLLDEMRETVRDYHPAVGRTGATVDELIQGTAFFPGGSGLWRGNALGGPLPDHFPDAPVMFVAHNYDSINAHARAKARRGEVDSPFWRDRLIPYISMAGIDPADVFFTNVLMGCKPGSAIGDMPVVPGYEEQCVAFLRRQIEIVKPRVVIAFGAKARTRVRLVLPQAGSVMHPSAREFNPLVTRTDRLREQAELLAALVRRES